MANSKLKCRGCGDRFKRETMTNYNGGNFHSSNCAVDYSLRPKQQAKGKKIIEKAWRADTVKMKKAAKSKGDWAKDAQQQFNRFIRLRDDSLPCISCQRHHEGQYHAGHYKTVGAHPELRFHEHNCHKQCAPCNNHLSGNISNYRIGLICKIGEEELLNLEGPQYVKRYAIKDYQRIKLKYKVKADELQVKIND